MTESDPIEEKALLYVLGELTPDQAREFEAELERTPELMECVRELEEGAVGVALARPQKRAPKLVWTNIERAIESERRIVVVWDWLRNKGWAAAAACLVGWLFFAVMIKAPENKDRSLAQKSGGVGTREHEGDEDRSGAASNRAVTSANRNASSNLAKPNATTIELDTLREQVRQLQGQLALLSQAVTQQQALLNDPARLKFIGLSPASNVAGMGTNGLSPQLQHAIGLAMARELGWLGNSNILSGANGAEFARPEFTNVGGVDFVDFRTPQNGTNSGPATDFKAHLDLAPPSDNDRAPAEDVSPKTELLPAFASNDHITVALDDGMWPRGTQIALSGLGSNGVPQVIGNLTMGSNPMVVTFNVSSGPNGDGAGPSFQTSGDGWNLIVTSIAPGGATNQMQFIATPKTLGGE
jgi:hypothetical protein